MNSNKQTSAFVKPNSSESNSSTTFKYKPFEELDLTDDYLFSRVFSIPKYFEGLISILLGRKVKVVNEPKDQATHSNKELGFKSVRFDVLFEDTKELIDLEMQNSKKADDLPKRASAYTSALVQKSIDMGKMYSEKRATYVIFLCNFDPFGANDYLYKAKYECKSKFFNQYVSYNTEDYHYFFNLQANKGIVPDSLSEIFSYLTNTTNYKITNQTSKLVTSLAKDIQIMKLSNQEREGYKMYNRDWEERLVEVKQEGIKEGENKQIYNVYINSNKDVDLILSLFNITREELNSIISKYE